MNCFYLLLTLWIFGSMSVACIHTGTKTVKADKTAKRTIARVTPIHEHLDHFFNNDDPPHSRDAIFEVVPGFLELIFEDNVNIYKLHLRKGTVCVNRNNKVCLKELDNWQQAMKNQGFTECSRGGRVTTSANHSIIYYTCRKP